MAGPIVRNYKNGSIIYFEKDKAEDIYVLQKGRVILTFTSVNGNELKEDVRLGEFFGVKSALGKYPREETAQVLGDATILVFKVGEFERFVSNKTHLIIKMLKVFSSQLRQVHRQLREILGEGEVKNAAFELMNVAEVFYKNGNYDHAAYAFGKYLEHYPQGTYASRAKDLLDSASKNSPFPINIPPLEYKAEAGGARTKLQEMLKTPASETKQEAAPADPNSIPGQSQKATTLINAEKYGEAETILKSLVTREDSTTQDDEKAIEKANYQLGVIHYKKNEFDKAFATLSGYVKNFPKGTFLKEAIFHLAVSAEGMGDKGKAKALYSKVTMLPPADDSMTSTAKNKLKELG
ncbi:MAG: cyclic nucleotide-binding domain-containing protein [Leptospira sp.]|nr:cyclic nucleotide-binding domain-containing protein [Leptospira sp.]